MNPLCIKLQDYFHPNIKNIYQIRYRNRNINFDKQNKNLLPYLSASANIFNLAILSHHHQKLTLYQKNITHRVKPQHLLHIGLDTKSFI